MGGMRMDMGMRDMGMDMGMRDMGMGYMEMQQDRMLNQEMMMNQDR